MNLPVRFLKNNTYVINLAILLVTFNKRFCNYYCSCCVQSDRSASSKIIAYTKLPHYNYNCIRRIPVIATIRNIRFGNHNYLCGYDIHLSRFRGCTSRICYVDINIVEYEIVTALTFTSPCYYHLAITRR